MKNIIAKEVYNKYSEIITVRLSSILLYVYPNRVFNEITLFEIKQLRNVGKKTIDNFIQVKNLLNHE